MHLIGRATGIEAMRMMRMVCAGVFRLPDSGHWIEGESWNGLGEGDTRCATRRREMVADGTEWR